MVHGANAQKLAVEELGLPPEKLRARLKMEEHRVLEVLTELLPAIKIVAQLTVRGATLVNGADAVKLVAEEYEQKPEE